NPEDSSRPLPGGGSGRVNVGCPWVPADEGRAEPRHPRRESDRSSRGQGPISPGQAESGTTRRCERHRPLRRWSTCASFSPPVAWPRLEPASMSLYTRLPPHGTLTDRRLRTEHNAASVWARIPEVA